MTDTQRPLTEQDPDECPCHVSPEELVAATDSLLRCRKFAEDSGNTALRDLLDSARRNNESSECPPVVLEARGPHIVAPGLGDCPCHVSPEELKAATDSLLPGQSFAATSGNTALQNLLNSAVQNNRSSECPPVVLRARGPH
jgi:hypothetical protein